ncbi:MAG: 3'-5' exonuclease [Cytophagales bacterium]|nr:3'-5' exonuclease [Cytophagales bacterium]
MLENKQKNILAGLNEPQREAVETTEGPLMIIAGAGSGKTRVLTYRIAYLLLQGADAFNILSLTFTNKAAKEMKERIEKVVGSEAKNLWMGTFHSVFCRILRAEADKLGYPNNFTVYDTEDSKSLLRTIISEMGLDDKIYKVSSVLSRISNAKNRLISAQEYKNNETLVSDDELAHRPKMCEIYHKYVSRCFKAGAMDFDDLLFNTYKLFYTQPDVLLKYQHRFKYIMVDEYQDTNYSQYLIVRLLSEVHLNIAVVGDDAQSIYAFRGADITNILNFEKDYPDLKVVKLEQNYRSTQNIVLAANSLINHNKAQLRKDVWTQNEEGNLIELIKASSDNEEGRIIATSIFEDKNHNGLRNKDFAVLYRTNAQSRSFEEALRRLNIPYKVIGGMSFYQRKEVKDMIAYLRFAINHNDEEAFKRIINYPKRGIGDTTVTKIMVMAEENTVPIWQVLENIHRFMPGSRTADTIMAFTELIKGFEMHVRNKDAYEAANQIAKESTLLKELYEDKTVEGLARYENLQALLNAIKEYTQDPDREDKSIGAFLQDIALLTSADSEDENNTDYVTLMTIHMAKGLEFKHVYISGLEEDLFPSQMMLESRADLEEERRLFYVAITRAEKKLTLSYCVTRYKYGKLFHCEPSRFISEINPKYIKPPKRTAQDMMSDDFFTATHKLGGAKTFGGSNLKPAPPKSAEHTPSPDFKPTDTTTLTKGMRVEHPKFGFGEVVLVDVSGNERKAKINFDTVGEKTLLLSFAKLMIMNN